MNCPGDLLSALVDGELDHTTRERVQRHLLGCTPCRREAEVLRALKLQLSWAQVESPVPPDELTARLMAMAVPGMDPAARTAPLPVRPASVRPAGHPRGPVGPAGRRRRRRVTGGALVALGLTTAFLLGGPAAARETTVPVDPTAEVFLIDFMSTTVDPMVVTTGTSGTSTGVGSTP